LLFIACLASIALKYTGLSWKATQFLARSAFTGTGFAASEAERFVDHPVRRRITMLAMISSKNKNGTPSSRSCANMKKSSNVSDSKAINT
jgi:hypothetical protein